MLEERLGADMQIRYEYDSQGRKFVIETYSSQPLPPNTGYAPHWEGSDMGFAPCPRCNLTTTYNDRDIAAGAELRDSQGKLLGHIVRTFDANGLVIAKNGLRMHPTDGSGRAAHKSESEGCWRIYGRRNDESKRLVL